VGTQAAHIDAAHERLRQAGWSPHPASWPYAGAWVVTVSNGDRILLSTGATEAEAWRHLCRQADALDILGPPTPGGGGTCN
jgi:hypothetical protein